MCGAGSRGAGSCTAGHGGLSLQASSYHPSVSKRDSKLFIIKKIPEAEKQQERVSGQSVGGRWSLGLGPCASQQTGPDPHRGRSRGLTASGRCVCRRPFLPSDPGALLPLLVAVIWPGTASVPPPRSSSSPAPERGPPPRGRGLQRASRETAPEESTSPPPGPAPTAQGALSHSFYSVLEKTRPDYSRFQAWH